MVTIVHELGVGKQFLHKRSYLYTDSEGKLGLECIYKQDRWLNNTKSAFRDTTKANLTDEKFKIDHFDIWDQSKEHGIYGLFKFEKIDGDLYELRGNLI
jgi:hypothetical protein